VTERKTKHRNRKDIKNKIAVQIKWKIHDYVPVPKLFTCVYARVFLKRKLKIFANTPEKHSFK